MDESNLTYIDNQADLERSCEQFAASEWLALDTEFLRESTYYPKFCLLQIADKEKSVFVDPLVLDTLDPLKELLFNENIVKVFHAARQDLEIFYNIFNAIPGPVFDTQIAAPLLGFGEQIGYAALVQEVKGTRLNKAHSRTDWSRRPLTKEQLRYAFDDVCYLGQVYEELHRQLNNLGRLDWLVEDFESLRNPMLYVNAPEQAWKRIRGTNRLNCSQLTTLQAVAQWREETAQQQNKPRTWLFRDDVAIDLARLQPESQEELSNMRGLQNRIQTRFGKKLCSLISEAKQNPLASSNGTRARMPKKTPEQEALLDMLMSVVRLRGAENSLNPTILASRKDLEQLISNSGNARPVNGWRKNLIGDELLAILAGRRNLTIVDGQLRITESVTLTPTFQE